MSSRKPKFGTSFAANATPAEAAPPRAAALAPDARWLAPLLLVSVLVAYSAFWIEHGLWGNASLAITL